MTLSLAMCPVHLFMLPEKVPEVLPAMSVQQEQ